MDHFEQEGRTTTKTASKGIFCHNCGAGNGEEAVFCKGCGSKLLKAEEVVVAQPQEAIQ